MEIAQAIHKFMHGIQQHLRGKNVATILTGKVVETFLDPQFLSQVMGIPLLLERKIMMAMEPDQDMFAFTIGMALPG